MTTAMKSDVYDISDLKIRSNNGMKKLIEKTLIFARKYPGWHEYTEDYETPICVRYLAGKGFIQVNQYHQFRATNWDGSPMIEEPLHERTPI